MTRFPLLVRHLLGLSLLVSLCFPAFSEADVRRALLVGIDQYDRGPSTATNSAITGRPGRRTWPNLQGSVNDVITMREVLIHRFGFNDADILVLTNQQATRANILTAFQHHLIDPARAGDLSIIFYAGHGSRIYNSNSAELDKKDETIVPADANSNTDATRIIDIRDKEWDRLFTQVLDRGAKLTAIFDSCHSGSISRGLIPMTAAVRSLEEDTRDVALLVGPEPPAHAPGQEPEKRDGALIVSAAQEDQPAREAARRIGDRKEWHGAFTLALVDTLNELPSTATAQRVFDQVTAKLKAAGHNQDPELAGSFVRRHGPLFGGEAGGQDHIVRLNIVRAYGPENVEIQGGTAVALTPGTELVGAAGASTRQPVRLRVSKVHDLLVSQAVVLQGSWKDLRPGDELEIVHRGPSHHSPFRLWLPPAIDDTIAALRLASDVRLGLPSSASWVDDPTITPPSHLVFWNGKEWILSPPSKRAVALGPHPTAAQVVSSLGSGSSHLQLFMNLPPSRTFRERLTLAVAQSEFSAEVTTDADEADYVLIGRAASGHNEHAWVLRAFSDNTEGPAHTSPMPLPVRTAWGSDMNDQKNCQSGGLRDCISRMAKLHHWLTVKGPEDSGRFPYRLGFESLADRAPVARDTLYAGTYRLILRGDAESVRRVQDTWGIQSRYVYVFAIDQQGQSSLLFPNDSSKDKENWLPTAAQLKQTSSTPVQVPLGDSGMITVHEPFGTDTYIMLTSARPIPRVKELVESDQVVSSQDPLRGQGDWSIDRQFLRSVPVRDR